MVMKQISAGFAAAALAALMLGCAAQPAADEEDAIADFIVAAELEPLDVVRLGLVKHWNFKQLNEDYIVLRVRDDHYLVEFRRRCHELNNNNIRPDKRSGSMLRAGVDTIRGCLIDRMFAIDKGQAEELEHIGKAP
jgi:hypothetical protein